MPTFADGGLWRCDWLVSASGSSISAGKAGKFAMKTCPVKPHQDALRPRVELRFRGLQVGSFEALAEAIIHRLQKVACLGGPALIMPQACKACRCPQLR
jgi:hypothetical protein